MSNLLVEPKLSKLYLLSLQCHLQPTLEAIFLHLINRLIEMHLNDLAEGDYLVIFKKQNELHFVLNGVKGHLGSLVLINTFEKLN